MRPQDVARTLGVTDEVALDRIADKAAAEKQAELDELSADIGADTELCAAMPWLADRDFTMEHAIVEATRKSVRDYAAGVPVLGDLL